MQAVRVGEVGNDTHRTSKGFLPVTANTQNDMTRSFIVATLLSAFFKAKQNMVFFQTYLRKIPRSHFHGKKHVPKATVNLGSSEPKLDQLIKISISEIQHRKD